MKYSGITLYGLVLFVWAGMFGTTYADTQTEECKLFFWTLGILITVVFVLYYWKELPGAIKQAVQDIREYCNKKEPHPFRERP